MKLITAMVVLVALINVGCDKAPLPGAAQALGSRLELVTGDVWLAQEKEKSRLITGAMLPSQAALVVGDGGRALVRMGTGSRIFLKERCQTSFDGDAVLLQSGEMWAEVPPSERSVGRFEAKDVKITASDASFDVAVDKEVVRIYVARGIVVVNAPGGRAELQSGERAVIQGKAAPLVEPVDIFEDWTGGMADRERVAGFGGRASGRIYGIDRANPGTNPEALQIQMQQVSVTIRDGVATTVVDQRFFNPASTALEGWYWFTIPEGASVERFALEVNGALVEGEMIERKQAAAAYEAAVQSAFDPALLEWVDGRTFRARIFPIPPAGERRVVLAYTEMLPLTDGVYRYVYPMGNSVEAPIAEFSLEANVGEEGMQFDIATLQEARIEANNTKVTMRRSGFVPGSDFLLELKPHKAPLPLRAMRMSTGEKEADYVMVRYSPDVDWNLKEVPGDVVVVLDTSAGGDDADRQIRSDAMAAILKALSAKDRFAVVTADLIPRVIYPDKGLAQADPSHVTAAIEKVAEVPSAGATDLGQMFAVALNLLYDSQQPAVVYIGDGRATVGETASGALSDRLHRALGDSKARLFTIAVGEDADQGLLERLARVGGGRKFRIDTADQTVQEALRFVGQLKTPTITDLHIDAGNGLDQVFSTASGKLSKGDEVILTARTHNDLPGTIRVQGKLGGVPFNKRYATNVETGPAVNYLPSLWARQYLDRLMGDGLDANRGRIIALGLNYALMTPFTSFLVLDSEAAYEAQGIKRRPRPQAKTASPDKGKTVQNVEMSMARRDGRNTNNRYAIKGPKDSPNPTMARDMAMEEASPTPSGDDPLPGAVPENAPATMKGYGGLGLQGIGAGGSGTGEGTIGHGGGGGSGYGRGAGSLAGRRNAASGIRSGEAMVNGALDKEVIRRIVHRHLNEIKFCYERQLAQTPNLSGKVAIKFIISGEGKVQMAAVAESTMGDPSVENCSVEAVRRWSFPAPSGGGMVIVTYPFIFSVPEGGDAVVDSEPDDLADVRIDQSSDETDTAEKLFTLDVCSDAASRPLWERRILWGQRLSNVSRPGDYGRLFFEAGNHCELRLQNDRRVLLDMIEQRVQAPSDVQELFASFERAPFLREHLRRKIVRRTLHPSLAMSLFEPGSVNWETVLTGLSALRTAPERVAKVRSLLASNPGDPIGRGVLVKVLFEAGAHEEAMIEATRLRRDELASPMVLEILCDLQAAAGLQDEAMRTCSEMVEFNAHNPEARQQLGDLFLRHGWYEAAYRQYETLVAMVPHNPVSVLRLASAAAGMGKVDEALRLERKVASGDGEPGPNDPRRLATFRSAARLALMLAAANGKQQKDKIDILSRNLKRSQAFTSPTTLAILIWEDYETPLTLTPTLNQKTFKMSDQILSESTGMIMVDLGVAVPSGLELVVNAQQGRILRDVPYTLITIQWDGSNYTVGVKTSTVAKAAS